MGIDGGQSGAERAEELEVFGQELDDAVEALEQDRDGGEIPFQGLPSFEELGLGAEETMGFLAEHFGMTAPLRVVKAYVMQGEVGTPGEGEIGVRVMDIGESAEDVYLGEYTYPDGDMNFTIRPLTVMGE